MYRVREENVKLNITFVFRLFFVGNLHFILFKLNGFWLLWYHSKVKVIAVHVHRCLNKININWCDWILLNRVVMELKTCCHLNKKIHDTLPQVPDSALFVCFDDQYVANCVLMSTERPLVVGAGSQQKMLNLQFTDSEKWQVWVPARTKNIHVSYEECCLGHAGISTLAISLHAL